jgi:CheY-like chemotaxis protein
MRRVRRLDGPAASVAALAVTAYASPANQEQALEAGFDMFRSKPIRPEDVALAVLDLLAQRRVPRRSPTSR